MDFLWLNVRFGNYHLQLTKGWKGEFSWSYNPNHVGNPKRFEFYGIGPYHR